MGTGMRQEATGRAYAMRSARPVRTAVVAVGCALSLAVLHPGAALACPPVPTTIDLGTLPSDLWAAANGINSRGQIVGWSQDESLRVRPFLWMPATPNSSSGVMTDIVALPDGTEPTVINRYGQVAGSYMDPQSGLLRAVLWTPAAPNATTGTMTELGTLAGFGESAALSMNDFGQIIGRSTSVPGPLGTRITRFSGLPTGATALPAS